MSVRMEDNIVNAEDFLKNDSLYNLHPSANDKVDTHANRLRKGVFIAVVIVETLIAIGFLVKLLVDAVDAQEWIIMKTYIIVLAITLVVCYVALVGAITENKLEIVAFLCSTVVLTAYITYNYFSVSDAERKEPLLIIRFVLGVLFLVANVLISIYNYSSWGWKTARLVGTDVFLQRAYSHYEMWVTLLKLDYIAAGFVCVVLGLFVFTGLELIVISCVQGVIGILWGFLGWMAIRKEARGFLWIFMCWVPIPIGYVIYVLVRYTVLKAVPHTDYLVPLYIGIGIFLALRVSVAIATILVLRNFGRGLAEIMFHKEQEQSIWTTD